MTPVRILSTTEGTEGHRDEIHFTFFFIFCPLCASLCSVVIGFLLLVDFISWFKMYGNPVIRIEANRKNSALVGHHTVNSYMSPGVD